MNERCEMSDLPAYSCGHCTGAQNPAERFPYQTTVYDFMGEDE